MKALLKFAALLGLVVSVAHGQSLPACPTSGAIVQSCSIAVGSPSSSLTISQSNILVQCQSGATLTQAPGIPIFDVEGTAANPISNITIDGCSLNMNNSSTGSGTVKVYETNGFTLRNSTITNIPESNAGIWLKNTSNSTVKGNTMLGPSNGIESIGAENNLQIIDNRSIGGISIISANDSDSSTTTTVVVSGNILSPDPNGGVCGSIGDYSDLKTKPITNFTFSHNTCNMTGTSSSHPAFAAYSFVSGDSGVCTVSDNVVNANGAYISYALWEIGLTNCAFSGNLTLGSDTQNQTYNGWTIYNGNNTFTGNTTIGWSQQGTGMLFYSRDENEPLPPAHGDNNVVTGGSLIATNPSGASGLAIVCNSSDAGASINNMKINGLLISGALNRGIDVEGDSTTGCPISVMLDSITISGATTGLETYNATIGVQNFYTLGVGTRWIQNPLTTVITPQ